jgi:hypothetical protein
VINDNHETTGGRALLTRAIAIACAALVVGGMILGYTLLRQRHAARLSTLTRPADPPPAHRPQPVLQVYEDEAVLKGPVAIIGGTVRNVSAEKITGITIELEMTRRKDRGAEPRAIPLAPKDLAPGELGRYSLAVPTRDFSDARIRRIRSLDQGRDLAYRSAPGAQRPRAPAPDSRQPYDAPKRPAKPSGDDFINTPDTATKIP